MSELPGLMDYYNRGKNDFAETLLIVFNSIKNGGAKEIDIDHAIELAEIGTKGDSNE